LRRKRRSSTTSSPKSRRIVSTFTPTAIKACSTLCSVTRICLRYILRISVNINRFLIISTLAWPLMLIVTGEPFPDTKIKLERYLMNIKCEEKYFWIRKLKGLMFRMAKREIVKRKSCKNRKRNKYIL